MLQDVTLVCGVHCHEGDDKCNGFCRGGTDRPPTLEAAQRPQIMRYFEYAHLPPQLQNVSRAVAQVAEHMEITLPDGPEKSAGLRKLLEAKDCFVRASLI